MEKAQGLNVSLVKGLAVIAKNKGNSSRQLSLGGECRAATPEKVASTGQLPLTSSSLHFKGSPMEISLLRQIVPIQAPVMNHNIEKNTKTRQLASETGSECH